jgi:DNA-binding CsgD family transcriptional regulator
VLLGRRNECGTLDRLLTGVHARESRALVVRGDPGVGKSALLEYMVERASGCRVVRSAGARSEMELAFAGLHQVCAPLLDRAERLPAPQRDALATAFGLRAGEPPSLFLVAVAMLGLLSEAATERPLVCVIDDAHWLDRPSAQALGFVARRLTAESVAIVFAVRESRDEFRRLPELVVEGLKPADARAFLRSVIAGPLDARVCDRIVAEAHGNPLALSQSQGGLSPAELAGGFGLPDAPAPSGKPAASFDARLDALPADSRRLLLVAAAEPVGDPVVVWRAAERLGISGEAAAPAAAAGLLELGTGVRFGDPLVRSAVYQAAPFKDRQDVHAALAEVTDREADTDRHAWHRAHAAPGPDEAVAADLERSAGRVQARCGVAAAAAFLEPAARLTPDPARRARRALAAAQAKHHAGAPDDALELLVMAEAGELDALASARVDLLRGQIASASSGGRDASPLLLEAATRLEPLDPGLARDTYLDALGAAMFAGPLARGAGVLDVAQAARAGSSAHPAGATDLLLDGWVLCITEGYPAGAPMLKRALSAIRSEDVSRDNGLGRLWSAGRAAVDVWDDETWELLVTRHVELARAAGALAVLPVALNARAAVHVSAGELAAAEALLAEAGTVSVATGSQHAPYGALALAAWQGREAKALELFETTVRDVTPRGEGLGLTAVHWASAVLYNGLGRYEEALAAAQQGTEHPHGAPFSTWALVELIEAAVRSGSLDRATAAMRQLSESTQAGGTDWALGIAARSGALLSEGEAAEELYRDAIERLDRPCLRVELARAHLLYGEWLRREKRRRDAREQLRIAHELFTAMGVKAFGARSARELLATGQTARRRTDDQAGDQLTSREAQIARLASDGLSNHGIGTELFISSRTVEYHLGKVFAKLDIASRHELSRVLDGDRLAQAA